MPPSRKALVMEQDKRFDEDAASEEESDEVEAHKRRLADEPTTHEDDQDDFEAHKRR